MKPGDYDSTIRAQDAQNVSPGHYTTLTLRIIALYRKGYPAWQSPQVSKSRLQLLWFPDRLPDVRVRVFGEQDLLVSVVSPIDQVERPGVQLTIPTLERHLPSVWRPDRIPSQAEKPRVEIAAHVNLVGDEILG